MNETITKTPLLEILEFYGIKNESTKNLSQKFSLQELVDNLFNFFQAQAYQKNIILSEFISQDIEESLVGNSVKLHQILFHLMHYALYYTERGFVKLDCQKLHTSEGIDVLEFRLMDTSPGISKEKINDLLDDELLNESFNFKEADTQDLALILSRELIAMLGGKLYIQSALGMGTKYVFKLAFQSQEIESTKLDFETFASPMNLYGLNILLVEDLEINQIIATTILRNWGANVILAEDGAEAVRKVETEPKLDIILMDVDLPIMNGLQATKLIRNELQSNIPIIALTANDLPSDREICLQAGMNEYVSKPFNAEELFHKIAGFAAQKIRENEGQSPKINRVAENIFPVINHTTHNLYDLSKLQSIFRGDELMIQKMQNTFLEKTPPLLTQINEGFWQKDWEQVSRTAHKLKASVDMLNIRSIQTEIRQIEACYCEMCDEIALSQLIEKVNNVCRQVFVEIENSK